MALSRRNKALGIRPGSLSNIKLPSGEVIMQNLNINPLWQLVKKELPSIMADLKDDPKYAARIKRIGRLLGDPRFPKVQKIYVLDLGKHSK